MSTDRATSTILSDVASHVREIYSQDIWLQYPYHNLAHTVEVVQTCEEIGQAVNLGQEELETLIVAAWWHDVGYQLSKNEHEEASKKMALDYLSSHDYPKEKIQTVLSLIDCTKLSCDQHSTPAQQIIHDADKISMGKKSFIRQGENLRKEWTLHYGKKYSEKQWLKEQAKYLKNNNFLSNYAQQAYGKRRTKNIKKISKLRKGISKKQSDKKYGRAIDTMYRVIYRNQINLSAIADNKANMLIGINAILLSVIITLVGGGVIVAQEVSADFRFLMPLIILIVSTGAAMFYAILAARPTIPNLSSYSEKMSIFFFENFVQLSKREYIQKINGLLSEEEKVYELMSEDIYDHGRVLSKKYRLLKHAYNIFMGGLFLSLLLFLILFFI